MPKTGSRLLCSVVATAALTCRVLGGTVLTLDGRIVQGTVAFRDGAIVVQPRIGRAIRVEVDETLAIDMTEGGAAAAVEADELPLPWAARDVGSVGLAGKSTHKQGVFSVTGSGGDIGGTADAFQFVSQEISGDFELIARVLQAQATHPHARFGLLIRLGEDTAASCAAVLAQPNGKITLSVRSELGKDMREEVSVQSTIPLWLKLTYEKGRITAAGSVDGEAWFRVGSHDFNFDGAAQVGLAVSSHDNGILCTTRFDNVQLTRRQPAEQAAGRVEYFREGVILRDGSVWPGAVRGIRGAEVHLARDGATVRIAAQQVARVLMRQVPAARLEALPPGSAGAILASGDFFEGEIDAQAQGRLRVSSVLHGIREFRTDEIAAIVLADVGHSDAAVRVEAVDGTVAQAARLSVDGERLVIDDPIVGRATWPARQLRRVTALRDRSVALARLVPVRVDPDARFSRQAWAASRSVIDGSAIATEGQMGAVSLAGGSAINYRLEGRYRTLIGAAQVDSRVAPLVTARFVIAVDGREVLLTDPRSSLDGPLPVAVNLDGAQELTLRIRNDTPVAAAGVWTEALLVRR